MNPIIAQFFANNPNPVMRIGSDGTVLYSNTAGKPLLHEWGGEIDEKLPPSIREIVKRVISCNSSEKMEIKVGNEVYLVSFHPVPEEKIVNIYGSDICKQKELNEKLRESERQYRDFFNTSAIGIIEFNPTGKITKVNDCCCQITGYGHEELNGMNLSELSHPDYRCNDCKLFADYLNSEFPTFDVETRYVRKDGKVIWVHVTVSIVYDPEGRPLQSIGVVQDISERKIKEEVLRKSEEQYRSLFNMMNEGFCIIEMLFDENENPIDYIFVKTNPGFEIQTGLSDVVGKRVRELIPANEDYWYETYGNVALTGESVRFDNCVKELNRWYEVHAYRIGQPESRKVAIHFNDITKRKQAEESLHQAYDNLQVQTEELQVQIEELHKTNALLIKCEGRERARLEELKVVLNSVPVAVWIAHDPQALHITGNRLSYEWLHIPEGANASKSAPEGERPDTFRMFKDGVEIPPEDMPVQISARGIEVHDYEFDFIYPDGEVRNVFGNASPLYDKQGNPRGSVSAFIDITDRKKVEEALKKSYDTSETKVKERTAELEKAYNSLKESEERLADAQKVAHIGNWEMYLSSGEVIWSDETYRIFGLTPQEIKLTYDKILNYVHPDDRNYVINTIREILKGNSGGFDYRIVVDNGNERIINTRIGAIFDERNIPVRIRGTVQDITERKKSEESLKESEERFRNLYRTISSGVAIYDVKGDEFDFIFKDMNPAGERIENIRREDIIGKSLYEIFPDVIKMGLDTALRRVWQTGKPELFPLIMYKDNRIDLWKTNYIYKLPSGELFAVFDDITEKRRAEESLVKLESTRKKEIHHRIKNNLQVISSLLDLQADKFRSKKNIKDSEVLEAFKESQDRVISMALIHEELHNSGDTNTINISQYIEELTDNLFLTYNLGNENTRLIKDIEDNTFFNMDISVPLGLIVNELISNSFKYAFSGRDNGEIRIKLHRDDQGEYIKENCNITSYVLTISDNGVGISEDLDIECTESLGLQLVTTLVEQLDGELEFKRGNGTEFILRFNVEENNGHAHC